MDPMTPPTLLVLAAGMGNRYGGLKQIDPVGPHGETIIDYSIYDALRAGFGKVVFVIRNDLSRRSSKPLGHGLKNISRSNTSFRNSTNFPWDFPPGRAQQAVGYAARGSDGRPCNQRALCRHQRRRFLRIRGLSRIGATSTEWHCGQRNGGVCSARHTL